MFSAVSALGAGGTQSLLTVDIANSILFAFFAVGGIVSGAAVNREFFLGRDRQVNPQITLPFCID